MWERENIVRACATLMDEGADIGTAARKLGIRKDILLDWYLRYREDGVSALKRRRRVTSQPLRTEAALIEALRRERLVRALYHRLQAGESANYAARSMKIPRCQLYRWRVAYERKGFEGLLPRGKGFGSRRAR